MNANAAAAARTNAQPHCNHTRNPGRHPAGWRQWVKLIRRGMGALFEPNSKSTEIRMLSWFSLKFLKLSLPKFSISTTKEICITLGHQVTGISYVLSGDFYFHSLCAIHDKSRLIRANKMIVQHMFG